jgi:phosphomannomutase
MIEEIVIKFGTDGWRGQIAADYTFDNVRRCAQGFASYLLQLGYTGRSIVIGHDKRFASEHFAAAAAEVLAANGLTVWLTDGATPTPIIAFSVVNKGAVAAINITASHNPPGDNGFKVRDHTGGAIAPKGLKEIEALIPSIAAVKTIPLATALANQQIVRFDPAPAYIEHIQTLIDLEPIRQAGLKIVVDAMWGNGAGWFPRLIGGGKTQIIEIHNTRNPSFPENEPPRADSPQCRCGAGPPPWRTTPMC